MEVDCTTMVEELTDAITRACDVAMARKYAPRNGCTPAYRWNADSLKPERLFRGRGDEKARANAENCTEQQNWY